VSLPETTHLAGVLRQCLEVGERAARELTARNGGGGRAVKALRRAHGADFFAESPPPLRAPTSPYFADFHALRHSHVTRRANRQLRPAER